MSDQLVQRREQAKVLHQRGEYQQAQAAYEEILLQNGEDADTYGLLALCKFQMGDEEPAFALWGRVNSMAAASRIVWRNCNNALGVALTAPSKFNAQSLLPTVIRPWEGEATPADMELAQSLMVALEKFECTGEIDHLLPAFIAQLNLGEAEALAFLRWALGKNYSATINVAIMERLDHVENPNSEILLLRGACHFMAGDVAKSEFIAEQVARTGPIYLTERSDTQKFVLGVMNRPSPAIVRPVSLAEFHFGENTPASLVKQFSRELRLLSFFPNAEANIQMNKLDVKPDIVLNNWATAEILAIPGVLKTVNEALEHTNVPVLNPPHKVILTTRQRNAENLKNVDGVVVPKVVRFENFPNKEISVAIMLEQEIGYPLILREPFQQMGKGAVKVETTDTLLAALARLGAGQFYAIAFVDNPLAPSLYRKYRAAVIGQRIFITHVHFGTDWSVHRIRDEELRSEVDGLVRHVAGAQALLDETDSQESNVVLRALEGVRQKIPLDVFGIDFDVIADGRLLFFEANAAMNISFRETGRNTEIRANMKAAFLDLINTVSQTSTKAY
jgi:glutathione synthase/RimK-type ligase-like ATP-grasp enzyme/tetratricopeptide (TPR) repeat protein